MRRSRYSAKQVEHLVANYYRLRARVGVEPRQLDWLVQLLDFEAALDRIPLEYARPIFLAMLGFTVEEMPQVLSISPHATRKRYRQGLDDLVYWINGGT